MWGDMYFNCSADCCFGCGDECQVKKKVGGKGSKQSFSIKRLYAQRKVYPPTPPWGGRVIVFTARNNVPLVAADRAFWDSKETMVPAGTDAIGQQADPAVFEWNTTLSGTKKHLRRALLFPSSLAKLGVEWINKGVDVLGCYRDLCTRFPGEDEYPDEKDWLLGASQGTPRDGSNLRLDFQQADQD